MNEPKSPLSTSQEHCHSDSPQLPSTMLNKQLDTAILFKLSIAVFVPFSRYIYSRCVRAPPSTSCVHTSLPTTISLPTLSDDDKKIYNAVIKLHYQWITEYAQTNPDILAYIGLHYPNLPLTQSLTPQSIIYTSKTAMVTLNDIITSLHPTKWLNDETIAGISSLLMEFQSTLLLPWPIPQFYIHTTQFLTKLALLKYDGVKRWSSRAKFNTMSLDFMFIPVFINSNHWALYLVDNINKHIIYFDSYHKMNPTIANTVQNSLIVNTEMIYNYLVDEFITYPLLDQDMFHNQDVETDFERYSVLSDQFIPIPTPQTTTRIDEDIHLSSKFRRYTCLQAVNNPQQNNSNDCGVFVLTMMYYIIFSNFQHVITDQKSVLCSRNGLYKMFSQYAFSCSDMKKMRMLYLLSLYNRQILQPREFLLPIKHE